MDTGDAGDRPEKSTAKLVRASEPVKHVLQTIIQHAAEAFHDRLKPLTGMLCMLDLSKITWKSNPGNVIEALLRAVGLAWSACGKKLWRRADNKKRIEWRQPAAPPSLKPAAPRATALAGSCCRLPSAASERRA